MGQWLTKTACYIFFQKYTSKVYLLLCWYQKYTFKVPKYTFCCVDQMLQRFLPKYVFCCVDTKSILSKSRRWPLILPTSGLPTGRQSWGRQFWVHQSSGLPTLIMKTYFDMFWTIHGKYNRLQCSSTVCNTFLIFWDQFNSSLITYHNLSLPRNSVNMISSLKMVIPFLFLVILSCDGVGRDIEIFWETKVLKTWHRHLSQKKLKWDIWTN